MPCSLGSDGPFLRLVLTGQVSVDELRQFFAKLEQVEQTFARVPHRLTDLCGLMDAAISMEDMRHLVVRRVDTIFPNRFRSAIVAAEPFQFGYARMFQMLNTNPAISIAIFTSVAEAEAWLVSPPVA